MTITSPVFFSKLYPPFTLLILGLGAWFFFRQLKLSAPACILGALATMLNSSFFSAACWGVGTHPITIGMAFLACGLLLDTNSKRRWLRVALAGLAVGMAVTEGADIGAIFSIYVAIFVVYQGWIADGPKVKNLAWGVGRVALVAAFAGFLAAQTISVLVATQISGVAGAEQDTRSKQERWDWATQWSLPKREALSLVVPGLFGYRMDTREGGVYWGAVGRDPVWDRYFASGKQGPPPNAIQRFTGGGVYAGILVVLVAIWAAVQGFRKEKSAFPVETRRWIMFWSIVAFIALLLSFGRFAPFYQVLYQLPYFSTIRNPTKFLHIVSWSLVILFAYGIHGLWLHYLAPAGGTKSPADSWRFRNREFDRRWIIGSFMAVAVTVVGWLGYASNKEKFELYLQQVGFGADMAAEISRFSVGQVGIFILFFATAAFLLMLVLKGKFAGAGARWGTILLGLFLLVDLGRANQPWIIVWDYEQKYATNPIIDFLRDKPYEHRVAFLPRPLMEAGFLQNYGLPPKEAQQLAGQESYLHNFYSIEWAQHHFLLYNVQSLDLIQMPRMPQDLQSFEIAMSPHTLGDFVRLNARRWQLTNTRYLIGVAPFVDFLNQLTDPAKRPFRIVRLFDMETKPGVENPTKLEEMTAVPTTNGNFAVIEYTAALPRVKLYSNWQIQTNDSATLKELPAASFDPEQQVIVAGGVPPANPALTNQNAGTVEFTGYLPKEIRLKAHATMPCVLLLNDRYDANWKVYVDGKTAPLLRCNYLMRGVFLEKGEHQVEFVFDPPVRALYVSLAAVGVAIVLIGLLVVVRDQS